MLKYKKRIISLLIPGLLLAAQHPAFSIIILHPDITKEKLPGQVMYTIGHYRYMVSAKAHRTPRIQNMNNSDLSQLMPGEPLIIVSMGKTGSLLGGHAGDSVNYGQYLANLFAGAGLQKSRAYKNGRINIFIAAGLSATKDTKTGSSLILDTLKAMQSHPQFQKKPLRIDISGIDGYAMLDRKLPANDFLLPFVVIPWEKEDEALAKKTETIAGKSPPGVHKANLRLPKKVPGEKNPGENKDTARLPINPFVVRRLTSINNFLNRRDPGDSKDTAALTETPIAEKKPETINNQLNKKDPGEKKDAANLPVNPFIVKKPETINDHLTGKHPGLKKRTARQVEKTYAVKTEKSLKTAVKRLWEDTLYIEFNDIYVSRIYLHKLNRIKTKRFVTVYMQRSKNGTEIYVKHYHQYSGFTRYKTWKELLDNYKTPAEIRKEKSWLETLLSF
ncbi:MAG: hypothetical protein GY754_10960 [bacterium]|nr:hypothetical protein [bacterium]